MMVCLHLFNNLNYQNLFEPLLFIGSKPLLFYISLFCDCCVAIYCFCSGYELYIGYEKNKNTFAFKNYLRLLKIYINYWIVLFLFAVILGIIMGKSDIYPGNFTKFILNFSSLDCTYNGAWWFISSYALLVLFSSFIFQIINKFNYKWVITVSFLIYLIAYIQRIRAPLLFNQFFLDMIINQITLLGNTQFPFVLGAISFQQKWFSKFSNQIYKFPKSNLILLGLILFEIIIHAFIPTLFLAVFTGFAFVFCFNALKMSLIATKVLNFFSEHSTNIWLTHMFFYSSFFKKIIFAPKYPIFIYVWLLFWCILTSYIINLAYKPILKKINLRFKV